MRPVAELTIKGTPGSLIDDLIRQALYIANTLGVRVLFDFNGCLWYANPGEAMTIIYTRHNWDLAPEYMKMNMIR